MLFSVGDSVSVVATSTSYRWDLSARNCIDVPTTIIEVVTGKYPKYKIVADLGRDWWDEHELELLSNVDDERFYLGRNKNEG